MVALNQENICAKIDEAFPFEVNKLPLFGPENLRTNLYGCFKSDTGENIGGAVKKNYIPHTLEDIKAIALAGMTGFDGAELHCSWNNGHSLIIQPTEEYRRNVFGTKDAIFPRGIIRAGYGGLKSFDGSLGLYRDTCANLMRLKVDGRFVSMRIKHTSGLMDKIQSLVNEFESLLQHWNGVADEAVEMNQVELNFNDFIRSVYPLPEQPTDRIIKTYEQRVTEIIKRLEGERRGFGRLNTSLSRATAWEAFNAVQGYEQHTARKHGRPDKFQRMFSALESPVVDKAYDLALEMAS